MNSKTPEIQKQISQRPYHLQIKIECSAPYDQVFEILDAISEGYDGAALAITDIGYDFDLFSMNAPDTENMKGRIALQSSLLNIEDIKILSIDYNLSEDKNWLEEVFESFPPQEFGAFCVFGSHFKDDVRSTKIPLQIDAALAFGSGEHATTQLCLEVLSDLKDQKFGKILDMGCGSGILAIAAKKLWPQALVFGVDTENDAVESSRYHANINACPDITFECGDGYKAKSVSENTPFDLVLANILTRPLISMAVDAGKSVNSGGKIIMSGILTRQKEEVLHHYKKEGFTLRSSKTKDGWACLLLEKE